MNTFDLIEVDRSAPLSPGGSNRARWLERVREPVKQIDFVVDGALLSERLRTLDVPEPEIFGLDPFDMSPVADLAWPETSASALRQLAGTEPRSEDWPLAPGRFPLYVCEVCGDLGCGAITVAVLIQDEAVVWSDFQMEDGFRTQSEKINLSALGPFTFDARLYRDALLEPVPVLEALAANDDEAELQWRANRGVRGLLRRLRHPG